MAIDWDAVKKDFERGGGCEAERLAEKHGCKAATITRRAAREGWKAAHVCKSPDNHTLLDDGSLWKGVRKRLISGLHNNDAKLSIEELKVAKLAGEVLSSVIKGERMAFGEADDEDDAQALARQMAQLTLPPGADEADEGE